MTSPHTNEPASQKSLRLWPGVIAVVLQWLFWIGIPIAVPAVAYIGVMCGLLGGLVVLVWWVFFSRAPRSERWGAVAVTIVSMVATSRILDKSMATGMMGMLFLVYATPVLSLAFVAWAITSRRFPAGLRRASMVATILLACGVWTLLRTGGITGDAAADFAWRWTKTPEERLLAQAVDEPATLPPVPATLPAAPPTPPTAPAILPTTPAMEDTGSDWPGFRGSHRDSIILGARIETDWAASPPVALWRRPVGPGWSSFAVHGGLLYTQEQRGDHEAVTCYSVSTGNPVWTHRDAARFWESNGGAGPRATPTLSHGRVYTFGATGILNALDARDGAVVWSRNTASDTDTKVPGWGFASSPLVVDDVVIVAAESRLAAYDLSTGRPRWIGPAGGSGYSSPQLFTIDGVSQLLFMSGHGAISVVPADGNLLWAYPWPPSVPIVQPALTADGDILIGTSGATGGNGIRRIAVVHGPGGWTVEERWTSIGLKPYFNDFVIHKGYAFGFDGSILACIDLKDGKRQWKGGRYGYGQLVLLPDQDLLLVLSEDGELALASASPDRFTELARFPAIEGKTWNHPVLVGDVLLVRNGQEMAAFRLSLARR
jgi:outer membrane protein assembly factor BamB